MSHRVELISRSTPEAEAAFRHIWMLQSSYPCECSIRKEDHFRKVATLVPLSHWVTFNKDTETLPHLHCPQVHPSFKYIHIFIIFYIIRTYCIFSSVNYLQLTLMKPHRSYAAWKNFSVKTSTAYKTAGNATERTTAWMGAMKMLTPAVRTCHLQRIYLFIDEPRRCVTAVCSSGCPGLPTHITVNVLARIIIA